MHEFVYTSIDAHIFIPVCMKSSMNSKAIIKITTLCSFVDKYA